MVIRSKNRVYLFDRHISDACLRLLVFALTVLVAGSAALCFLRTNTVIDQAFWVRLQNALADFAGRETDKLGTSETSLFTKTFQEMEKEGAGMTRFPEYAERFTKNNQAIEMIRFHIRDLRLLVHGIGAGLLALTLLLVGVLRSIYGNGESRFRLSRWLYRLFNPDSRERQLQTHVHSFTPLQRKIFEVAFSASKGNPDGAFELDLMKIYRLLYPSDEEVSERRRAEVAIAFHELCEEFFYFQISLGQEKLFRTYCPILPHEDKVSREFVRDVSGREVDVYKSGHFQFSPPLYSDFLKNRYPKLPHAIAYALDDRKNPYAFRLYILLWEMFVDQRRKIDQPPETLAWVPLASLLQQVCCEMVTSPETNLLEQLHLDISALKDFGLIRACHIDESGEKVPFHWYKDVDLFVYDATTNKYQQNSTLLAYKRYSFDLAPWEVLEKIKPVKRRCAYMDEFDTPCARQAQQGSPYCKRHAKVLEHDAPRIFYGKMKFLPPGSGDTREAPSTTDETTVTPQPVEPAPPEEPRQAGQNETLITPPPPNQPPLVRESDPPSPLAGATPNPTPEPTILPKT